MEKQDFRGGWRFSADSGPSRLVTLPHDAMQERRRAPDAPSGSGCAYYLGGVYEYEKTFLAPEAWRNQTVLLEFEGVYPTAEVFVNGKSVGGCAYGYSLFRVELKGLQYGRENTVRVHVDGSRTPDSRWYSGAGVYRPVWLLVLPERHILPDGVRVTTLSHAPAEVRVETAAIGGGDIRVEILDGDQVVAQGDGADVTLPIPNGKLWSAEHPHLYRCRVTLLDRGAVLDERTVPFGIRTLSWSAGGFFVNGESVKLKGGCVHHDHGILGARSFPVSEYRRVKKLKEFGFNALRSAHNPAPPLCWTPVTRWECMSWTRAGICGPRRRIPTTTPPGFWRTMNGTSAPWYARIITTPVSFSTPSATR